MPNVIICRGLACVALLNTKIFLRSDIKIDSNLGESVRTRRCVGANVFVFNKATIIVGLHITDLSVILITDGKHGSTIFLVQLCHAEGDRVSILRCDLYRTFDKRVGCGSSGGINQDGCLGFITIDGGFYSGGGCDGSNEEAVGYVSHCKFCYLG